MGLRGTASLQPYAKALTHAFVGHALPSHMHHMCSCPKAVGPWVGMPPQLLHALNFGKNGILYCHATVLRGQCEMVARDGVVRPATRSVRAARSARDDTARPVRDAARSVQDGATRSARDGAARSMQDGYTRSVRDGAARSVQMVEGQYVRSCDIGTNGTRCCEIGAKCCEIGTRCCGDWCEMVRDSTRCCRVGTRSMPDR